MMAKVFLSDGGAGFVVVISTISLKATFSKKEGHLNIRLWDIMST